MIKRKFKMLAYYYFKTQKKSCSKEVLSAHMMTSMQVWAFSKK